MPERATLPLDRLARLADSLRTPLSNRELLLESLDGRSAAERERAAEELRRRLHSPCAAAMARFTRTPEELEDYTQRLYERLVKKHRAGKDVGDLSDRYLYLVAQSLIQDDLRRARLAMVPLPTGDGAEPLLVWAEAAAGTAEEAIQRLCLLETYRELVRELTALKPREAAVVRHRADGLSYQQIASALDISEQNARQIFHRARKLLATHVSHVI